MTLRLVKDPTQDPNKERTLSEGEEKAFDQFMACCLNINVIRIFFVRVPPSKEPLSSEQRL